MSLEGKTIVFRADGSQMRGIGHLMRCLAFADGVLAAGAEVVLASIDPPSGIVAQFKARGCAVLLLTGEAAQDISLLSSVEPDWIVIDSYDITADMRSHLRGASKHLAIIDDGYDNGPYAADLVINPNPGASAARYDGGAIAIGAQYVLIRQDIVSARAPRSFSSNKICISCGGSDPASAALRSLKLLNTLAEPNLTIRVIIGPMAKSVDALKQLAKASVHSVTLTGPAQPVQQHLNWADFAILAAGTTQWEAAYLGCPFISLIVADNQAAGALAFQKSGGSVVLDWRGGAGDDAFKAAVQRFTHESISLRQMSDTASALIDGQGGQRLAEIMAQIV